MIEHDKTVQLFNIAAGRLATMEQMEELTTEPKVDFALTFNKTDSLKEQLKHLMIKSAMYRAGKLEIFNVSNASIIELLVQYQ